MIWCRDPSVIPDDLTAQCVRAGKVAVVVVGRGGKFADALDSDNMESFQIAEAFRAAVQAVADQPDKAKLGAVVNDLKDDSAALKELRDLRLLVDQTYPELIAAVAKSVAKVRERSSPTRSSGSIPTPTCSTCRSRTPPKASSRWRATSRAGATGWA